MKTLYSLAISVFTILLIASCDSSTSADSQQGERIGTFMVYDNQMDWVGVQSQSKSKGFTTQAEGDTTFFDYPDGKNLYMVDNGDHFMLAYQDSSYDIGYVPETTMENPLRSNNSSYGIGLRDDHLEFTNMVSVDCDSTYSSTENIIVSYFTGQPENDSTFIESVVLKTDGIVSAAKSMQCNQAP